MKKAFCDLCGEPALRICLKSIEYPLPKGAIIGAVRVDRNTSIEARLDFKITGHPTGYGLSPDLCIGCVEMLAEKIIMDLVKLNKDMGE